MATFYLLAVALAIEANYSPPETNIAEKKNPAEPLVLPDCGGEIGHREYTPYSNIVLEVLITIFVYTFSTSCALIASCITSDGDMDRALAFIFTMRAQSGGNSSVMRLLSCILVKKPGFPDSSGGLFSYSILNSSYSLSVNLLLFFI